MHITDVAGLGALGANGIVGAGQGISAGSAFASKYLNDGAVTVGCFGDSSTNQGLFHEAMNMAATWKLPLVWFIENNSYGVSTDIHRMINTETLSERAKAYGAQGVTVDGTDVFAVYEAMKKAMKWARDGKGPYIVEAKVYRYQGHYCGDPANYRPASYMEEALKHDAIETFGKKMIEEYGFTQEELDQVQVEADAEMDEAVKFADESPYPDPDTLLTDVYAEDNERCVAR